MEVKVPKRHLPFSIFSSLLSAVQCIQYSCTFVRVRVRVLQDSTFISPPYEDDVLRNSFRCCFTLSGNKMPKRRKINEIKRN